jgi:acyl carrier protein
VADVTAIIGLAGRFPGEPTIETLWRALCGAGGPLAEGSGRAPWMSRMQLFLDCATEAIENAAYATRIAAGRTGLFLHTEEDNEGDGVAVDVASELGLSGPAITVSEGATLAAVETACRSLGAGECGLALAGGSAVQGEAVGVVVLKRLPQALADGDRILAAICGSAVGTLVPPPPSVPRAGHDPAEAAGEPGPPRERPELASAYAPPANRLEAAIATVWQQQLGIDRVGVDDNFFALGGTSIAGVKIIALLKDWLLQDIPILSLYEGPTVSALARVLLQTGPAKSYDSICERGERCRRKLQRLRQAARQEVVE